MSSWKHRETSKRDLTQALANGAHQRPARVQKMPSTSAPGLRISAHEVTMPVPTQRRYPETAFSRKMPKIRNVLGRTKAREDSLSKNSLSLILYTIAGRPWAFTVWCIFTGYSRT